MNDKHPELFETLEPPRGGLARLRARIERDTRRRIRLRRARALAAATLAVAFGAWVIFTPRGGQEPVPEFDFARMSLGQLPWPTEALTVPEGKRDELAARRVPLPTDEVVFYLIASIQDDAPSDESG